MSDALGAAIWEILWREGVERRMISRAGAFGLPGSLATRHDGLRLRSRSAPWSRRAWATRRPSPSGSSGGPLSEAKTRSRPSGSKTAASSVKASPVVAGPGGHRDHAAPFQLGQGAPLGEDGAVGRGVVQRGEQGAGRLVVATALDPQGPLADRRQEPGRAEPLGDVGVEAEPAEAGLGQDDGVELAVERLVQPGLDVPPDPDDVQVGPAGGGAAPDGGASRCRPSRRRAGRRGSGGPGRSGRRPRPRERGRPPGPARRGPGWAGPSGCGRPPRRPHRAGRAGSPW